MNPDYVPTREMPVLELPSTETLELRLEGWALHVTLNRPAVRNAMSRQMVTELLDVVDAIAPAGDKPDTRAGNVRAVVLRGAGGHFCAGGDIKDMAQAATGEAVPGKDPIQNLNRSFGAMLQCIEGLPVPVIAVCEGAVMGGGFGLACVADVTIAVEGARFRLPETSLGITPAQIAPYLVRRMGITHARRLGVTGATLSAKDAVRLSVAHLYAAEPLEADAALNAVLKRIGRCEPTAVAATKRLMLRVGDVELDRLLDRAAAQFATLARSEEAVAGMTAFITKTAPPWAEDEE